MGKSSRLTIVLAEARVYFSGMLALLLTLSRASGAGAFNFTFNGFSPDDFLRTVPESKYWSLDNTFHCFKFDPKPRVADASGQFLYPVPVAVLGPGSRTVKSFHSRFIFRFRNVPKVQRYKGPIMSLTMFAEKDSGDIYVTGHVPLKNHESQNTPINRKFNDRIQYQQTWVDYNGANNQVVIYRAIYKKSQRKPVKPTQESSIPGLDVSLLKGKRYIGFSIPKGIDSSIVPYLCAWSFSNDRDRPAPPIDIAPDNPEAATPPPPSPRPPPRPPTSPPQIPPSPSPSPITPSPSPSPISPSPSPSPISPSPNRGATLPSGRPLLPPPSVAPSPGPGHEHPPINVPTAVGVSLAVLVVLFFFFLLCWRTICRRSVRIFLAHAGGPNGDGKNFPSWLYQALTSHRWSRFKFHVKPFLDVENCRKGLSFARRIFKELERFDVGVVVVTPDYFSRHWPMTELIKFVEAQRKDREGRIRVLPLFYKLTPDELKQGLDEGTWENFWVEPSEDNHSLQLQECKDAVAWLCKQTGIRYVSHDRDQDKVYIDTILKEVDKILCDERSFTADLHWVLKKLNNTLRWVLKKLNITGSGSTATTEIV